MSKVEIYRLKKGGAQEVMAEFSLVGEQAVGKGNGRFIKRLETQGVLDKTTKPPTKVYPTEGHRFLESLKSNFKSGYFTASEVTEDKSPGEE